MPASTFSIPACLTRENTWETPESKTEKKDYTTGCTSDWMANRPGLTANKMGTSDCSLVKSDCNSD